MFTHVMSNLTSYNYACHVKPYILQLMQGLLYQVRGMESREMEAFSAFYTRLAYTTGVLTATTCYQPCIS